MDIAVIVLGFVLGYLIYDGLFNQNAPNTIYDTLRESVINGDISEDTATEMLILSNRADEERKMIESIDERIDSCDTSQNEYEIIVEGGDWYFPKYFSMDEIFTNNHWGYLKCVKESDSLFDDWTIDEMYENLRTSHTLGDGGVSFTFKKKDVKIKTEAVETYVDFKVDDIPKYVSMNEYYEDSINELINQHHEGNYNNSDVEDYEENDDWFCHGRERLCVESTDKDNVIRIHWKLVYGQYYWPSEVKQ